MMFAIRCNLTFSMTLNFIAIVLAITGILNPVAGALIHNSGSVFVIINSALLLKWRKIKTPLSPVQIVWEREGFFTNPSSS